MLVWRRSSSFTHIVEIH